MIDEATHKRNLLSLHTQRLYALEEQIAALGKNNADPALLLEREDLRRLIGQLEAELKPLAQDGQPGEPPMALAAPLSQTETILVATERAGAAAAKAAERADEALGKAKIADEGVDEVRLELARLAQQVARLIERVDWLIRFVVGMAKALGVSAIIIAVVVVIILIKVF